MMLNTIFLDAGGPIIYAGVIFLFIVLPLIALILLIYFFNKRKKKKQQQ